MDESFISLVKSNTTPINLDLGNGLATIHMKAADEYIENVLRVAEKSFPPGVVYEGSRRCTPYQSYEYNLRKKGRYPQPKSNQKNTQVRYETAPYDFYIVEHMFSFNGEKLKPVPIAMPVVGEAGSVRIKGTTWYISPVLADRVISVGEKNIFVRLMRDKLTFMRDPYYFKVNGERQNFSLVHANIYHASKKKGLQGQKMVPRGKTTVVHYLFCKYGVEESFKKFAGCTPIIGEDLINTLDLKEYAVFHTVGIPPSFPGARFRIENYIAPKVQIAVKHSEVNDSVRALVTGLFYVADMFPQFIETEYVNRPMTWITPMGFLLFPETMPRGRMIDNVDNHCESLDHYADPMVIEQMRRIGINISDIYEFFAIIASQFDRYLLDGVSKINSMYDKEMSVLYFVFLDLTSAIFSMTFGLKAAAKKPEMTLRDVDNVIRLNMRMTIMHDLQKVHGEIQNINYSGDNKLLKPTATLVPQTSTNKLKGNKGSDRGVAHDATKRLHVSVAEVGAVSAMSKSDPTGRSHRNVHTLLSPEDKSLVLRNPKLTDILDTVQEMIRRR